MAELGPTLHTDRLILGPPRATDFDAWAEMARDETTMTFIGGVQPRAVAWRGFLSAAGAWAIQGFGMFSVFERDSNRWIGRIGPIQPEGWPGAEVGWGLSRESWGKGYAVEAATAAIDFTVDVLGWTEIIHCIDSANVSSQKVARRLGSTLLRQGRLPPPIDEEVDIWGQTAEQWRGRRC